MGICIWEKRSEKILWKWLSGKRGKPVQAEADEANQEGMRSLNLLLILLQVEMGKYALRSWCWKTFCVKEFELYPRVQLVGY